MLILHPLPTRQVIDSVPDKGYTDIGINSTFLLKFCKNIPKGSIIRMRVHSATQPIELFSKLETRDRVCAAHC